MTIPRRPRNAYESIAGIDRRWVDTLHDVGSDVRVRRHSSRHCVCGSRICGLRWELHCRFADLVVDLERPNRIIRDLDSVASDVDAGGDRARLVQTVLKALGLEAWDKRRRARTLRPRRRLITLRCEKTACRASHRSDVCSAESLSVPASAWAHEVGEHELCDASADPLSGHLIEPVVNARRCVRRLPDHAICIDASSSPGSDRVGPRTPKTLIANRVTSERARL